MKDRQRRSVVQSIERIVRTPRADSQTINEK
jgi:hypothetical protein